MALYVHGLNNTVCVICLYIGNNVVDSFVINNLRSCKIVSFFKYSSLCFKHNLILRKHPMLRFYSSFTNECDINELWEFITLLFSTVLSFCKSRDLLCKSRDWFLYDRDLRHERVKCVGFKIPFCATFFTFTCKKNASTKKNKIL